MRSCPTQRGNNRMSKNALKVLMVILVFLCLFVFVQATPKWETRKLREKDATLSVEKLATIENESRKTLVSALTSLGFLFGIWFGLERLVHSDRTSRASEENTRIATKSQNLERLTKSVEYLHSDLMSKRIIGLLTLGNLAVSYPEEANPILLASVNYVRERIPFRERSSKLPDDVYLAITQISKINSLGEEYLPEVLVLDRFSLIDASFKELSLERAEFDNINLENATFRNCVDGKPIARHLVDRM